MRVSKILSIIVICVYMAACGSTTTTTPLSIHTANDPTAVKIKEGEQYKIILADGREMQAEGNAVQVRSDAVYVYSTENERWDRYERAEVQDVYLETTDKQKRSKKRAYITGAAVLAAFAAALTGGYFIEKNMK